jgi:Flp pilus assembly protein TadG
MGSERGAAAIIAGLFVLFIGLGVAAFAIDFGYRHVARNELQNAADAGALAGARALYYGNGSGVNVDGANPPGPWNHSANQIAYDAARANRSANEPVEVNADLDNNLGDVQRGHWCFGLTEDLARGFYPNDSTVAVNIGGRSLEDLDSDTEFINAVRVVARRQASPVSTFFARIFGHESFTVQAEAIAYRGLSGSLPPGEIDMVIALCAQTLWVDVDEDGEMDVDEFIDCEMGRMLNSGPNASRNTGAWTNLSQPCVTGNPDTIRPLLEDCLETSPGLSFGQGIGCTGGTSNTILESPQKANVFDCWVTGSYIYYDEDTEEEISIPVDSFLADGTTPCGEGTGQECDGVAEYPWTVTVPVIDCPSNNACTGGCGTVVGSVTVNVAWILNQTSPPTGGNACQEAPYRMFNPSVGETGEMWEYDEDVDGDVNGDGEVNGCDRWDAFVDAFNLANVDDQPVTIANGGFMSQSLYFLPSCIPHDPAGTSGGDPFGLLAEIPVLVK